MRVGVCVLVCGSFQMVTIPLVFFFFCVFPLNFVLNYFYTSHLQRVLSLSLSVARALIIFAIIWIEWYGFDLLTFSQQEGFQSS